MALVLAAGCGSGGGSGEGPAPAARTIAFLRAVASGQPENQAAFLAELASEGYARGRNLTLLAEDPEEVHPERADAEATVRAWRAQGVDVIVALSTAGALAAAAAAPGVTVLFLVNDPIAAGVRDVRRPEGRSTGVAFRVPADRTLDLARRALPGQERFGIVYPPSDPAALSVKEEALQAAGDLGIDIVEAPFSADEDVPAAVEALRAQGVAAVWALNSPTTFRRFAAIGAAASAASLPVVTNTTADIAVLTLQPDVPALYRQLARQAARVLGGTPVSSVPVENPARFVVDVNLAIANRLGLVVADDVVAAADRVIR